MKNKKIFIAAILCIIILFISNLCFAAETESTDQTLMVDGYDMSDIYNYVKTTYFFILKQGDDTYLFYTPKISSVSENTLYLDASDDFSDRFVVRYGNSDFSRLSSWYSFYFFDKDNQKWNFSWDGSLDGKSLYTETASVVYSNQTIYNADKSTVYVEATKERGTTDSGSTGPGSGNVENTTGDNTNTTTDFSSTGVFSWIAKGLSDVINFLKSIISGVGNLATSLGELFGSLFTNLDNGFTNSDISMKNFFAGIPEFFSNFWENFVNFLKGLFIPSEERLTAISDSVKSKFGFVDSIKISIDTIKDNITGTDSKAIINVTTKPTKYTDEMKVKIIDFSWYAPFKPYGDLVITGFCYAMFIWRLFMKLPGIIHGTSASVEPFNDVKNYYSGGGKR